MSAFLQAISLSALGAILGSLFFSLWLAILFYVYIYIYGYLALWEIAFLGEYYIKNSLYEAFVIGTIIGSIQGFITGIITSVFGMNSFHKGAMIGFVVTEAMIFGVYFFFSVFDDPNPIALIFNLIENALYELLKISLILLIPSILTGVIITKLNAIYLKLNL